MVKSRKYAFYGSEIGMEAVIRISKTDLARNTRQVINDVLRGHTAFIESHGKPEAAIIDIVDYRILRAVMRYHMLRPKVDPDAGLVEADLQRSPDAQARYDQVMAHYLAGGISLGRAAELLGTSWLDLRTRCLRLDVLGPAAPATPAEASADLEMAARWDALGAP
jgi:hypothetical protein